MFGKYLCEISVLNILLNKVTVICFDVVAEFTFLVLVTVVDVILMTPAFK